MLLRRGRLSGGIAVAALALAALPAGATATTYCVAKPACVTAGGTARATIQGAFDSAAAGAGTDRVEVGAGTFDDGPFSAEGGNPITLVGAGSEQTTLTQTSTTPGQAILKLIDPGSSVQDVEVLLNGEQATGIHSGGDVKRVRVGSASGDGEGQLGILVGTGGDIVKSKVLLPMTPFTKAVQANGQNLLRDSAFEATNGIDVSAGASVVRSKITATQYGLTTHRAVVADNVLIRMLGGAGFSYGVYALAEIPGQTVTARHLTIAGPSAGSAGVYASGHFFTGPCPQLNLALHDSIVSGFATDLETNASGSGGCTGEPANATIEVARSNFDPAQVVEHSPGSVTEGPGNLNVSPRFVNAASGNFRLERTSPLAERGTPGPVAPGQSARDLDRRKRVIDSDSDGTARREIGAFELPRR